MLATFWVDAVTPMGTCWALCDQGNPSARYTVLRKWCLAGEWPGLSLGGTFSHAEAVCVPSTGTPVTKDLDITSHSVCRKQKCQVFVAVVLGAPCRWACRESAVSPP